MFQINEKIIFIASIISTLFILIIETLKIEVLSDLQIIAGIYLLLIPVGFLFVSVLMPFSKFNLTERLLLSIVLSVSINSLSILVLFFLLGIKLTFLNNLFAVTGLCVLFYAVFLLQLKFHPGLKPPENVL